MGRAPCCDKANVKRGPWSPEEDATLMNYVQAHGTGGNWIAFPRKAGLKRCGKSCRLRWLNYLRPDIKHGGFTEEEDNIIYTLYHNIGSRWSVIASHLQGRTDNGVKNYWNAKLKKKMFAGKISDARKRNAININHEQILAPISEAETCNPGNYSPSCLDTNSAAGAILPPLMEMGNVHDHYSNPQGLILEETRIPVSNFIQVSNRGTYGSNSYSASSSSSSSLSSASQEVPRLSSSSSFPLDSAGSWSDVEGRAIMEEGEILPELGLDQYSPFELLNYLGFQEKYSADNQIAPYLGIYSNLPFSFSW